MSVLLTQVQCKEWENRIMEINCTKFMKCACTKVLPKRKESFVCRVLLGRVFQGHLLREGKFKCVKVILPKRENVKSFEFWFGE